MHFTDKRTVASVRRLLIGASRTTGFPVANRDNEVRALMEANIRHRRKAESPILEIPSGDIADLTHRYVNIIQLSATHQASDLPTHSTQSRETKSALSLVSTLSSALADVELDANAATATAGQRFTDAYAVTAHIKTSELRIVRETLIESAVAEQVAKMIEAGDFSEATKTLEFIPSELGRDRVRQFVGITLFEYLERDAAQQSFTRPERYSDLIPTQYAEDFARAMDHLIFKHAVSRAKKGRRSEAFAATTYAAPESGSQMQVLLERSTPRRLNKRATKRSQGPASNALFDRYTWHDLINKVALHEPKLRDIFVRLGRVTTTEIVNAYENKEHGYEKDPGYFRHEADTLLTAHRGDLNAFDRAEAIKTVVTAYDHLMKPEHGVASPTGQQFKRGHPPQTQGLGL